VLALVICIGGRLFDESECTVCDGHFDEIFFVDEEFGEYAKFGGGDTVEVP